MGKIDIKLDELYVYIQKYIENNGFAPTVRDICSDMQIKSTATAHYYLNKLKERGLVIKPNDKKRAISIKSKCDAPITVPLIGTVTAGTPILAVENFEGYYPIPQEFSTDSDLFMLKVKGDSMINAGIFDGDKIIVKKQETANNGDIVVCLIDDSATVKRFFRRNGKVVLHPENDKLSDMIYNDVLILGVVKGLMRKI